jgi:hypothetical protein
MRIFIAFTLLAVTAFSLTLGRGSMHESFTEMRVGGFTEDKIVAN